jgi:arsenate reductase
MISPSTWCATLVMTCKPGSLHYYATSTSDHKEPLMADKPSVLFVCVQNAGRSQMAAGYLNHLSGGRIEVRSAGSEPADKINPVAVQAMAEEGIDIAAEQPKILTTDAVKASDVVITLGCGDTCPYYPGKRYEDWVLDDPAGQDINHVRPIRDQIRRRVEQLITELQPVSSGREAS